MSTKHFGFRDTDTDAVPCCAVWLSSSGRKQEIPTCWEQVRKDWGNPDSGDSSLFANTFCYFCVSPLFFYFNRKSSKEIVNFYLNSFIKVSLTYNKPVHGKHTICYVLISVCPPGSILTRKHQSPAKDTSGHFVNQVPVRQPHPACQPPICLLPQ